MALSDPVLTASLFSTTAVTGPATASTTTVAATAASDVSIAGVMIHGTSPPDSAVITGGGLTWTKVATVTYAGAGNHRLTIFKAQGVISSGATITFGPGGTFVTTGQDLILAKCPGASPTPVQFKTAAAATDPITVTADVAPGASNLVLLFGSIASVTAFSSGTGTEMADGTHSTPACRTGLYWDRTSPANPMTMTNAAAVAWAAASVELTEDVPPPPLTGYAAEVSADTPAAWYRMGEASGNALDSAGSFPLTVNATVARDVAGGINATDDDGAIDFQDSGFATLAGSSPATGNTWSLEVWINPDTISGTDGFMGVSGGGSRALQLINGVPRLMYDSTGPTARTLDSTAGALTVGRWYHVVATHDNTTVRLYVNGVEVANAAFNSFAYTGVGTINVGRDHLGNVLDGRGDEAVIYDGVLSPTRVLAHYIAGLGRVPSTRRFAQLLAH